MAARVALHLQKQLPGDPNAGELLHMRETVEWFERWVRWGGTERIRCLAP